MLDKNLSNYVDYKVYGVTTIKAGYGYRVVLIYSDGSRKTQQKSGFSGKREARKAREKTIAELYSGEYAVYTNVLVEEFMVCWLDEDIRKRIRSDDTYSTFQGTITTKGVSLPKHLVEKKPYHTRKIDTAKTLTLEQMLLLIEKSKGTKIHMQVLFNALMGLRRGEINGIKYSDVDYVNRTLSVERQLGKVLGAKSGGYTSRSGRRG